MIFFIRKACNLSRKKNEFFTNPYRLRVPFLGEPLSDEVHNFLECIFFVFQNQQILFQTVIMLPVRVHKLWREVF